MIHEILLRAPGVAVIKPTRVEAKITWRNATYLVAALGPLAPPCGRLAADALPGHLVPTSEQVTDHPNTSRIPTVTTYEVW